jgi:hypothetical protein
MKTDTTKACWLFAETDHPPKFTKARSLPHVQEQLTTVEMAQRDPDERLVYLACQHIFRGSNSQVRKRKHVMNLLQQNKPTLTDILREHSIDRTCDVAKKLLDAQVFYSALRAKIRFPELFDVSPAQSAEREASEAEAARDEAKAVREISERETSREVAIQSQARPANEESYEIDGWYSYERIFALFVDSQHHQPLRQKSVSIIQSHLSIQSTYITKVSTSSRQAYKDWWKKLVSSTLKVTSRSFW